MVDTPQDMADYIKGCWRSLNSSNLNMYIYKISHSVPFDVPIVSNDLPGGIRSSQTLAFFSKKATVLPLLKSLHPLVDKLPGICMVFRLAMSMEQCLLYLFLVSHLRVCLGRISAS